MAADYVVLSVRALIAFFALLFVSKLMGQQFKVVAGVTVAGLCALMSVGVGVRLVDGLLVLAIWGVMFFLMSMLSLQATSIRSLVSGKPTVIIQQGKVLQNNLKKARLTAYDMMSLLREKNAFTLADVEFSMLEPDGQVSVMLKTNRQPVTPLTENIPVENQTEPTVVVVDGKVITDALANTGFELPWLWEQVTNQGATQWEDVFLAQIDSTGSVYVDLYDDVIQQPKVQSKPLLLASLKKHMTDFEVYALQTDNPKAKALYLRLSGQMAELVQKAGPYLRG